MNERAGITCRYGAAKPESSMRKKSWMVKNLAQTARGIAWLTNFEDTEQKAARQLLEAVTVVSETRFMAEMKGKLFASRAVTKTETVAAFPVQALSAGRGSYFVDSAVFKPTGSELLVENVLRKQSSATDILLSPSVEKMRARKVDVVLLVTDLAGSGSEILKFLSFLYDNPSVRSWHSSHHIRFEVMAHTISERARTALLADRRISSIHSIRADRGFDRAGWNYDEKRQVVELCEMYADDASQAFGWGGGRVMTVFGHTFGNGLPRILLQRRGKDPSRNWIPLLPLDRASGMDWVDDIETSDYTPSFSALQVLESLAATDEVRALQKQEKRALERFDETKLEVPLLEFLIAIRLGVSDEWQLQRVTNMTSYRLTDIAELADLLGYVADGKLTPLGVAFVRRSGRRTRTEERWKLSKPASPYYPRQLR